MASEMATTIIADESYVLKLRLQLICHFSNIGFWNDKYHLLMPSITRINSPWSDQQKAR